MCKLTTSLLTIFSIVLFFSVAFAFEPMFDTRIDYGVGDGPRSVFSIDLDDGDNAQATANNGSDNVSISWSAIVNEVVGSASYSASGLEGGTTHYWRVRAGNECGWSNFTSYRVFTTVFPIPDPPILESPANGATDMIMPLTLEWSDVATADVYQVVVDNNSNFSSPEIDEAPFISGYDVSSGLAWGVKYYWRVRAHNSYGWGYWSTVRWFTMQEESPLPADKVQNTADDGDGSLRWVIDNLNSNPDLDTIGFYVSGVIQLITPLPSITDDGMVVLGSSAPGGAHSVILDGSGLSKSLNSGLVLQGSNCIVEGLVITGFPGNGIEVTGGSATGNTITNNLIYENGLLGIDLNDDGVTLNDLDDLDTGPNDLLNYPELDSLYMNPDSSFTAYGYAAASAIIEFFVAHPVGDSTRPEHATGHGEAYNFIGTDTADGGGNFSFDIAKETGQFSAITMTATDVSGNTSEFSDNYTLIASPLIIVGYADSPDLINLKVTDPEGDYIGKDADGVLGQNLFPATYDEIVNDSITIMHPIQGVYLIEVIGETGAAMRGVYAVGIRIDGTNEVIIAANAPAPEPGETDSYTYEVEEDWHFINGDVNRDELINILDIVYLINYKYKGGPAPYPLMAGEIDCIDPINILDIIYLINFKYKGGPEPCAIEE